VALLFSLYLIQLIDDMAWLMLPVENNKDDKDREPTRFNSDIIKDYRPYKSNDGIKRTIFYFKEAEKKQPLISTVPTEAIDRILNVANLLKDHEQTEMVD